MNKILSTIWLAGVILLSLAGLIGFYLLFVRDMNIYWLILSPMIIAIYEIPAVFLLYLWKKKRRKTLP